MAPPLSTPPDGPEVFSSLSYRTLLATVLVTPAVSAAPLLAQVSLTLISTSCLLTESSGKQSDVQGETEPPLLVLNWWPPRALETRWFLAVLRWEGRDGGQEGECWIPQEHSGAPCGLPCTPNRCVGTTVGGDPILHLSFSPCIEIVIQLSPFPFLSFELEAVCISKSSVLSRETHSVGAVLEGSLARRLGAFCWEK